MNISLYIHIYIYVYVRHILTHNITKLKIPLNMNERKYFRRRGRKKTSKYHKHKRTNIFVI